jgi:membrane protein
MFVAFSFLYWFLPNTEVRPLSALLGGAVGGVLFSLVQKAYVGFQVGAAKYNAIFGTFAALPLFMVWMYISWAIVLLGAEVAYAHQTLARYRREVRGAPAGPAAREALGLAIALQVARAFHEGRAPWTTEALSEALDVPLRTVREVMGQLEEARLVRATQEEGDPGYQLGRPADRIRVEDVLAALRGPRETPVQLPEVARVVGKVFEDIDRETHLAAEASSLRDLVEQLPAEEAEEGAAVATGAAREVPA